MTERGYILPVTSDVRIRHYHKTQKGKVTDFLLQLEVKFRGNWREVIRYDTSHGFTHIDRYNSTITSRFLGGDFP